MAQRKILVVDDEEMIVRLCWKVLSNEGYEVKRAFNGEEAVKLAFAENFDMVVTDMLMSGIDGLETFLALKEKQPEIIGVLITAHGSMDTAIEAMGLGFSGFVRKPFTPFELTHVVKDAFQKSDLREENTRLKTLVPLYNLGERFVFSRSRKEILDILIETVEQQMGVQRASVMLYDEEEDRLKIVAARGLKKEVISRARIKPGEKISGRVFESSEPIILNGSPEENPQMAAFMKARDIVAAISFPLKTRDKTLGVLNISKIREGTPFCQADIETLAIICRQAVMALENFRIAEERTEKMRIRTIFEQYIAPEVTETLISGGIDPMNIGEIKDIAILFADIRNFTPLVRQLPLETLRSFLNDFFGLLTEAVFKFEGTLDKFIGDAVLASFGAPISISEPIHKAVHSAIMMHKKFEDLKKTWLGRNRAINGIGLGIGINYGETFLGNVGSPKRFDYTVIGIDVNIAQRLASVGSSGQTLITEKVKAGLDSQFHVIEEPLQHLKGLDKPMPVFSVTGC
ncbi:MAG: response regulator [Deltaproteobacteria bacterium]|nr:response regulator [Deltaproteobacteria bacterium]